MFCVQQSVKIVTIAGQFTELCKQPSNANAKYILNCLYNAGICSSGSSRPKKEYCIVHDYCQNWLFGYTLDNKIWVTDGLRSVPQEQSLFPNQTLRWLYSTDHPVDTNVSGVATVTPALVLPTDGEKVALTADYTRRKAACIACGFQGVNKYISCGDKLYMCAACHTNQHLFVGPHKSLALATVAPLLGKRMRHSEGSTLLSSAIKRSSQTKLVDGSVFNKADAEESDIDPMLIQELRKVHKTFQATEQC